MNAPESPATDGTQPQARQEPRPPATPSYGTGAESALAVLRKKRIPPADETPRSRQVESHG